MNVGPWRHVSASVIGTSHERVGGVCQDSNTCVVLPNLPDGDVLLAVVADGAGSARQAETGSTVACRSIRDSAALFLATGRLSHITKETVQEWVTAFQQEIADAASELNLTLRDYACTLLASIVGMDQAVFFQIGDGSIVVADSEEQSYGHVFWPERGEYENATFFATDVEFANNLQFENVPRNVVEVAMFSDGLQRLALDFAKSMPHEPFFRGLFPTVRRMPAETTDQLTQSLSNFLGSSRVNERTDDDKTLVLATRLCETNAATEYAHSK